MAKEILSCSSLWMGVKAAEPDSGVSVPSAATLTMPLGPGGGEPQGGGGP
jgi:hypothetical protein